MKSLKPICRNLLLAVAQILLLLLATHPAIAEQLSWSNRTVKPTAVSRAVSAVVNGKIFILGGATNGGTTAAVEAYDPLTDSWQAKTSLSETRFAGADALQGGIVYIAGGSTVIIDGAVSIS